MRAEIRLLGPLDASVAGVSIAPSAPKQRQILAMLALNVGSVVPISEMIEEIWGKEPPGSPLSSLQTYVLKLRRMLEPALAGDGVCTSKDVLATGCGGYRLDIPPGVVDVTRYEALYPAGRRAADNGDHETAARTLAAALDVWRGPALVDVAIGPVLSVEVTRLEESRLSAMELRIDAELRLGRHRRLLEELAMLCARHPWFESFHAQYMLALYRSGRPCRALEVYRTLYATVTQYLGIDPSRRLRQLHQAILSGDPAVDDPSFVFGDWAPAPV